MCKDCEIDEQLNYHDNQFSIVSDTIELMADTNQKLEFRTEVLKRYLRINQEHTSQLEDKVYRLETVLSVMCHQLGINLVEPLHVHRPARSTNLATAGSELDTHLASWRSVLETSRTDTQSGGEEETGIPGLSTD